MSNQHNLTITWGTSRGRNTYGYITCTLRENGRKLAACKGGGYDMRGTVFGDWLAATYQARLLAIADTLAARWTPVGGYKSDNENRLKLYGGCYYLEWSSDDKAPHVSLDGACGFESMRRIAEAIGLRVQTVEAGRKVDVVIVTDTRAELEREG